MFHPPTGYFFDAHRSWLAFAARGTRSRSRTPRASAWVWVSRDLPAHTHRNYLNKRAVGCCAQYPRRVRREWCVRSGASITIWIWCGGGWVFYRISRRADEINLKYAPPANMTENKGYIPNSSVS